MIRKKRIMKDKKGFTLVELLAVIAILGFLALLALPNLIGTFNVAKKRIFLIETQEIYKTARYSWANDKVKNPDGMEYGRCSGCSYKELPLNGRKEVRYYVKVAKNGCVTKYVTDDGTYRYEYNGQCMMLTDIDSDSIIESSNEELNTMSYVYSINFTPIDEGSVIPSSIVTFNNLANLLNTTGKKIFLRYGIEDDKVASIAVGFIYNNNIYYLDPLSTFAENKAVVQNVFDSRYCYTLESPVAYSCLDEEQFGPNIDSLGWIAIQDGIDMECHIDKHYRTSILFGQCTIE